MKLSSLLNEDHVIVHADAPDLGAMIKQLLDAMAEHIEPAKFPELADRIIQREISHPRIVGDGAYIAQMRTDGLRKFCVAVGVPENPISHPREPGRQLQIVFLILAPREQNMLLLQTGSAVSRLLSSKAFIPSVKGVKSASRLIRLIEETGVEVKRTIAAGDVMEKLEGSVTLSTSLPEAVDALAAARDEGLPVFDKNGRLVGEITTREILQTGMPRYMDLLTNPEMLNAFEPFENYFRNEDKLKVRDICRRDFCIVDTAMPIVRVAHIMIAENRRRIYVQQDEKIEGVIYRKSILMRVMNQ